MRQEGAIKGAIEGALPVKHNEGARNNKKKKSRKYQGTNGESGATNSKSKVGNKKGPHPPYQHCGGICISNAGEDQKPSAPNAIRWGMKLLSAKVKISNTMKRLRLLIKRKRTNYSWLHVFQASNQVRVGFDNGCTNHMTHDKDLFKELRSTNTSRVRI